MPEDAELALVLLDFNCGSDRPVHTEELVVLSDQLRWLTLRLAEDGEVLDEIEQSRPVTHSANDRLQTDQSHLAFVVDLLPLGEVLPASRHAADLALRSVRQDDDG